MVSVALYRPDQPGNVGAMLRLTACLAVTTHLIHPCGFPFSHKALKRAGMDYTEKADLVEHDCFEDFQRHRPQGRTVLLTVRGEAPYYDFAFRESDILMTGRESAGVPDTVREQVDAQIYIPMRKDFRSVNVGHALAVILGEALRQTEGFKAL